MEQSGRSRWRLPLLTWPVGLLFLTCGLIVAMALVSRLDAHTDEAFHVLTASYYQHHWLPPAMDDPQFAPYLHRYYGASYLMASPPEIAYLLAAKARMLLWSHGAFGRELRWFNIILFLGLVLFVAFRRAHEDAYALCLLLTPQLWYIFSYFNGDAWPFFLAFLVTAQLGQEGSLARQFLDVDRSPPDFRGGLLLGVLLGLLLLSKQNYYVFIVFVLAYAAWRVFSEPRSRWWPGLRRWGLVGAIGLLVAGPVAAYDAAANGFSKSAKSERLLEHYAASPFKPSRVASADSHWTLRLRAKGEPLANLVVKRNWLSTSFISFVGVYGYMKILSPTPYFCVQAVFYAVLAVLGGVWLSRHASRRTLVIVSIGLAFAALAILQSLCHSWTYDFQPQGRYLFPVLPILLLTWLSAAPPARRRLVAGLGGVAFLMGAYSFVAIGLAHISK